MDGWQPSKSLGNVTVSKGVLNAIIAGNSAAFANRKDLDIDTAEISNVTVKYANVTNSEMFSIYFLTDDNNAIDDKCRFRVPVRPMDESLQEFVIDVKDNEKWTGVLKRIVIVPEECTKGRISVDSVSLIFRDKEEQ